jgi:hypothetical protein
MPGSYSILSESKFVYSCAWGVLTDEELVAHAKALKVDPRFEPTFAQLADFTEVSDVKVTSACIQEMTLLNPFGAGARRVLIAPTPILYGLARMYELTKMKSDDEVMVVRDVAEALKWLGDRAPGNWEEISRLKPDWVSEAP